MKNRNISFTKVFASVNEPYGIFEITHSNNKLECLSQKTFPTKSYLIRLTRGQCYKTFFDLIKPLRRNFSQNHKKYAARGVNYVKDVL
jgi:hypothetical protein